MPIRRPSRLVPNKFPLTNFPFQPIVFATTHRSWSETLFRRSSRSRSAVPGGWCPNCPASRHAQSIKRVGRTNVLPLIAQAVIRIAIARPKYDRSTFKAVYKVIQPNIWTINTPPQWRGEPLFSFRDSQSNRTGAISTGGNYFPWPHQANACCRTDIRFYNSA